MKLLKYTFTLLLTGFLLSCNTSSKKNQITDVNQYSEFLNLTNNQVYSDAKKEEVFWSNKLNKAPNQYPYLSKIAAANNALFTSKGSIQYLITAEKKLQQLNQKTRSAKSIYIS